MTVRILQGDYIEIMSRMESESIDCVATSPAYWGLRDYGVKGQHGLETTLASHLEQMVRVFGEVWRVLKPAGTAWLNYGDCYAATVNGRKAKDIKNDDRCFRDKPFSTIQGILKPKDLCMVPNRLAIALQEAGWWVRSEIIWAKPNPLPESVRDRPAVAHEKIFLLTKSSKYYYNDEAVRVAPTASTIKRLSQDIDRQTGSYRTNGGRKTNGPIKAAGCFRRVDKQCGHGRRYAGFNDRWNRLSKEEQQMNGRNLRNYEPAPVEVWEIATFLFKEGYFATFPPKLVERCLKAGCPAGGVVLDPYGGAGTTRLVAERLHLDAILIELNPDYIEIARRRIKDDNPLFANVLYE